MLPDFPFSQNLLVPHLPLAAYFALLILFLTRALRKLVDLV